MTYPEDPWDSGAQGGTSTDLALPSDYSTGLEDLGADLSVPRLKIAHKRGLFVDPSDNSEYNTIFCVILGLVKQRVLFDAKVDPNSPEKPMCKSPDTVVGFPNMRPDNPKKAFPWAAAKLDPSQAGQDSEGRTTISCDTCHLQKWDSHPLGDKPWCSEQFTMPILYAESLEELMADRWMPALLSMQKTAIKPTKNYLKTFQLKGIGAYTAYTKIELAMERAGDNVYSKPTLSRVGSTNRSAWLNYIEQFKGISDFLKDQRPPTPDDGSEEADGRSVLGSTTGPVAHAQGGRSMATQAATVTAPATAPVHNDNDLPF